MTLSLFRMVAISFGIIFFTVGSSLVGRAQSMDGGATPSLGATFGYSGTVTVVAGTLLDAGNTVGGSIAGVTQAGTGLRTLNGTNIFTGVPVITNLGMNLIDPSLRLSETAFQEPAVPAFFNLVESGGELTVNDMGLAPGGGVIVTANGTLDPIDGSFSLGSGTIIFSSSPFNPENEIVLITQAVPEPTTWAMITGGLLVLAFGRRLKQL